MTPEQREFVSKLEQQADHEKWLYLVRFGLSELLQDQRLLASLMVSEARRMSQTAERKRISLLSPEAPTAEECFGELLGELNLRLSRCG